MRNVVQWSVATHDHAGLPFVVVDKSEARIYAFDPQGRLRGTAPVQAEGGDATPFPAGRFTAEPLAAAGSASVVWANGTTRVAVRPNESDVSAEPGAALRVAPEFWQACVAGLRAQPSIAYVLPQSLPAAVVMRATWPAHEGDPDEFTHARQR